MNSIKVKICGVTREEDLKTAVIAGADAVGFVVGAPSSPRNLALTKAEQLMKRVPIFIESVMVTVLTNIAQLTRLYERLKPNAIQVHGQPIQNADVLRENLSRVHLIRAIQVGSGDPVKTAVRASKSFDAILLDSPAKGKHGGTGIVHDWRLSRRVKQAISPKPLILAGGLKPENIKAAIQLVQPYAVDVSSGVESRPGIKDPEKIFEFINNAREACL